MGLSLRPKLYCNGTVNLDIGHQSEICQYQHMEMVFLRSCPQSHHPMPVVVVHPRYMDTSYSMI